MGELRLSLRLSCVLALLSWPGAEAAPSDCGWTDGGAQDRDREVRDLGAPVGTPPLPT